ncbi:hypothetical protein [Sagittula salina]|uniref:Uncharacterized protein n=1 Tax=Sagittula salina TaxID=2820268 RepID=A0A940MQF6_9RHOB|nr:hypothetical protein [Sagittula salina]MBP0483082.1 hypothetical protein [Sagittula salina]
MPAQQSSGQTSGQILSVAPIGSCRIVDPLRQARPFLGVEMNRGRSLGFCHSSPEAVQQMRYLLGEVDIDEALWPFVSGFDRAEVAAQRHEPSDIYIVELSSEKVLSLGDTLLQLNYLRTQYADFFKDNARKNAYWKAIERETQGGIDALLSDAWGGPERAAERDVLRQVRLRRADAAQTREDMRALANQLPNVMFVTHVNARENGAPIKTRDRYVTMVKEVAQAEGLRVFDPTEAVMALGQADALESDLNHYHEDFKPVLAEHWYDAHLRDIIADLVRARGPAAMRPALETHLSARVLNTDADRAGAARDWLRRLALVHPDLRELHERLVVGA